MILRTKKNLFYFFFFCVFFLGSCIGSYKSETVFLKKPFNLNSKNTTSATTSSENPQSTTDVEYSNIKDDEINSQETAETSINSARFKFFALDFNNNLITLDKRMPLTFCVQRVGPYSPLCRSLRAHDDGPDYSSSGQQGSPRSLEPSLGVSFFIETDPLDSLGTEYYFSAYQPAGYVMKFFKESDPYCRVNTFSDLDSGKIVFQSYADARDSHLGKDNPKVFLKKKSCQIVIFQYIKNNEIDNQYSGQKGVNMVQPHHLSEWLSVDSADYSKCNYDNLGLKDREVGKESLPICGTHHVFREDGGNKDIQLGMMISLSSPFGGVVTDFNLWWRNATDKKAQGVTQIAEVSTPTDSGIQYTAAWSRWKNDSPQYDSSLSKCVADLSDDKSPIFTSGVVWNQLSGGVSKYDVQGFDNEKETRLTPCARTGLGYNWGFDVQMSPIQNSSCELYTSHSDKNFPNCTWTEGSKFVPFASDIINTNVGNLDTTPAFFPFGYKPYLIAGKPNLYMFTRRSSKRDSSVITAIHQLEFSNLIPKGVSYHTPGDNGIFGQGSWRAFRKEDLIKEKAYLILVDTEENKIAWAFGDSNLKLNSNSKVPGTNISIIGNLGNPRGLKSNSSANSSLLHKMCWAGLSDVSCRNGKPTLTESDRLNTMEKATIDRILFVFPVKNTFRVLSLHRLETESRTLSGKARTTYKPSPFLMSVNDKRVLFAGPFFSGSPGDLLGVQPGETKLSGSIMYPDLTFVYDYGLNEDLNDLSLMGALSGF